jgi:hypothetical protein
MSLNLGTLDGLIGNVFVFGPGILAFAGLIHLTRRGFFGPHQ